MFDNYYITATSFFVTLFQKQLLVDDDNIIGKVFFKIINIIFYFVELL